MAWRSKRSPILGSLARQNETLRRTSASFIPQLSVTSTSTAVTTLEYSIQLRSTLQRRWRVKTWRKATHAPRHSSHPLQAQQTVAQTQQQRQVRLRHPRTTQRNPQHKQNQKSKVSLVSHTSLTLPLHPVEGTVATEAILSQLSVALARSMKIPPQ